MPSFKTIASNTFYQLLARLSSSVAGFFIAILIAKFFGVNGYGDYAKVTAYIGLFYLFVDFGCNAVFLRKNGFNKDKNFGELAGFRLLLSFAVWIFAVILSFLLPASSGIGGGFTTLNHFGIFIFSGTIITEGIVYSASAKFQNDLSYKKLAIATGLGSIITFLGVVIVIWQQLPVSGIFVAFLCGSFVRAVISLFLSGLHHSSFKIKPKEISVLFSESSFVAGMLIANMIYFRIDMLILSLLRSSEDVAQYDFAYKFFDFLIALPLYVSNVLYPSLVQSAQKNILNAKGIFKKAGIFAWIGLVFCIGVFVCAPVLGIIKPEFSGSVTALRIFSLFLPVFFATNILQWALLARGEQKFLFWVYIVGAGINIFLNLKYIPAFGFIGASVITGISEMLVLGAMVWRVKVITS